MNLQVITVISPLICTFLLGILTYKFAIKSKKFDLLYASKIPAFKEIAIKLTNYKTYCWGKYASINGMEFAAFFDEPGGALFHRKEIASVTEHNAIFLSKQNRKALEELIGSIGILCNIELHITNDNLISYNSDPYENAAKKVEALIDTLYKDLNLT